ncbi:hypothetical protein T484DRAFT_1755022 [Baffinella frigidus]|nr:hypothetical protein T484DRAFT_1755022 [Cryptophyta sp. CCMP2293]
MHLPTPFAAGGDAATTAPDTRPSSSIGSHTVQRQREAGMVSETASADEIAWVAEWSAFLAQSGSPKPPAKGWIVDSKCVNVYTLYHAVVSRGGIQEVRAGKKIRDVASEMRIIHTMAYRLPEIYQEFLYPFERWKLTGHMDETASVDEIAWVAEWRAFLIDSGSPKPPASGSTVDYRSVNMYRLYHAVMRRGGIQEVEDYRRMVEVAGELRYNGKAGQRLRVIYMQFLQPFELWKQTGQTRFLSTELDLFREPETVRGTSTAAHLPPTATSAAHLPPAATSAAHLPPAATSAASVLRCTDETTWNVEWRSFLVMTSSPPPAEAWYIHNTKVNAFRLYQEVVNRGGMARVEFTRTMTRVSTALGHPKRSAQQLKSIYNRFFYTFECWQMRGELVSYRPHRSDALVLPAEAAVAAAALSTRSVETKGAPSAEGVGREGGGGCRSTKKRARWPQGPRDGFDESEMSVQADEDVSETTTVAANSLLLISRSRAKTRYT